jgi:Replication-relaxation
MRASPDPVLRLQSRLTPRDLILLNWLYDHQILYTHQIAHALFPSLDAAQKRLLKLLTAGLLDRFRPLRMGGGSYPWRYLLGQTGMELVAAARGDDPVRRDAAKARRRSLTESQKTGHLLGVNQFFVDLAGHARLNGGASLDRWLSSQQCDSVVAYGTVAQARVVPDGHGVWTQDGATVAFYFEYDTGTERLATLVDKIERYNWHVDGGAPRWPVLFSVHSARHEQSLHNKLAGVRSRVPIATLARDQAAAQGRSPADAVWLVRGGGLGYRRLADLSAHADPPPTGQPPRSKPRREKR